MVIQLKQTRGLLNIDTFLNIFTRVNRGRTRTFIFVKLELTKTCHSIVDCSRLFLDNRLNLKAMHAST